jgi:lysozyme
MRQARLLTLALGLSLLLGSCTSSKNALEDIAPSAPTAAPSAQPAAPGVVTVRGPRYGDRKPHDWDRLPPWSYAVHGTDVSKYQTEVDWHAARRSGINFAFVKATEGGDRVDAFFERHWAGAKAAGVARGAYHFYYFCRTAREQAEWFIRNVPKDPSALPPVLDMEWNHLSPTCKLRPPAATVQAEMKVWLEIVGRHYGKRPIIYTSIDFYEDNRLDGFHGYDWWLRSVSAHPHDRYGGRPWRFWQYTGTGEVPGMRGDADINVFNGDAAEWRKWLRSVSR